MNESDYHNRCDELFAAVETLLDDAGVDFDSNGNVIDAELDNGEKIIINRQPAAKEVWLASPDGGHHFVWRNGEWQNTRGGEEFTAMLQKLIR